MLTALIIVLSQGSLIKYTFLGSSINLVFYKMWEKRVISIFSYWSIFRSMIFLFHFSLMGKKQSLSWMNHNETVRSQKVYSGCAPFLCYALLNHSTQSHLQMPWATRVGTRGLASWIDCEIMESHSNKKADTCSEWQEVVNHHRL